MISRHVKLRRSNAMRLLLKFGDMIVNILTLKSDTWLKVFSPTEVLTVAVD